MSLNQLPVPDTIELTHIPPYDLETFIPHAESQAKSATVRTRSIVLHGTAEKREMEIDFKDTARLGFEWCFEWEGEKYRWYVCVLFLSILYMVLIQMQCRVRESRITSVLECRCARKTGKLIPDRWS